MFQILVVEDDASLRKLMSAALKQHGYVTFLANDGLEALDVLEKTNIDLIISDIMMPNMDGYELTRQLRKADFNLPILMVTAKETFEDKQEGFSAGTDDYMVKPFAFEELMARIRCVTRRSPILTPSDPSKVCLEDLTLFIEEKRLMGPAGQCTLSQREAVLTEVLLRAGLNTPMPRTTLLLKVWGPDNDIEDGNLDNYIHFLRRRFRQLESTLQIKTLRGTGYCLTTADERN